METDGPDAQGSSLKYAGLLPAALAGLALSFVAAIFALLQGEGFATFVVVSLVTLHVAAAIFAVAQAARGKPALAMVALLCPAFVLYAGVAVFALAQMLLPSLQPAPPEFAAACKGTGAEYFAVPATPVKSLAYDWEGKFAPAAGSRRVGAGGRVIYSGGRDPAASRLAEAMQFVERRELGTAWKSGVPFKRIPRNGAVERIAGFSADALVFHRRTWVDDPAGDLMLHQLDVTDRRDGRRLARLRYVLGKHSARLCGPLQDGVLSEDAFLVRALGLE